MSTTAPEAPDPIPAFLPPPVPAPRRETGGRPWLHLLLLLLTVVTTTVVGAGWHAAFQADFTSDLPLESIDAAFFLNGLWYSATILAILGCHEMGHYLACRWYDVDASLPYFLPAPLPLTGTLGAFIRIRSRIPSKTALFDIGIAGPLAGFVVAVPALFLGLALSRVVAVPANFDGFELGEPLLFRAASWLVFGNVPDGLSVNMHPMAFAAWFGLLATALNLFPFSQLDGGHIAYAVLGRRSVFISILTLVVAVALAVNSMNWIVWALLLVAMLVMMGPHHPPTLDDTTPVGSARIILAIVALAMLILCFTPAPIEPFVTGH